MGAEVAEVAIVGGGPAGLSAALVLGRARRRVLLVDDEKPRNAAARAVRGFLSRDGTPPDELRRVSLEQLARYPSVTCWRARVEDVWRRDDGFTLALGDGRRIEARALLLATGVVDSIPDIPGAAELYGRSVFHCPYCDGYELSGQPLAVLGRGDDNGAEFALELLTWSDDLVLFTHGRSGVSDRLRDALARYRIPLREERVTRLVAEGGDLRAVELEGGEQVPRRALFFNTSSRPAADLAERLGCELDEKLGVDCTPECASSVPGVFVAGDASRDLLQVSVAAGEGARAAVAIDRMLWRHDRLPG